MGLLDEVARAFPPIDRELSGRFEHPLLAFLCRQSEILRTTTSGSS